VYSIGQGGSIERRAGMAFHSGNQRTAECLIGEIALAMKLRREISWENFAEL
jgi:hypothetical protein